MPPHIESDHAIPRSEDSDIDGQTRAQLDLIREIDEALSRPRVGFWLRGGWAIDFLLGEVTRPHADIDLVAWLRHRERVQRALVEASFELIRETEVQSDFCKNDQDVSFVFLKRAGDGGIVAHGIPEWTWRTNALPHRRFTLRGICARVVSPQQLLDEKEGYASGGRAGRPARRTW